MKMKKVYLIFVLAFPSCSTVNHVRSAVECYEIQPKIEITENGEELIVMTCKIMG